MATCHQIKHCHLITHIVAHATCCGNTYGWKCNIYHIYMLSMVCCMQLHVGSTMCLT